jgi:hypothetical protein
MRYFCTYFDQHYLPYGLSLYRSLREHSPAFRLWVLCLDEACRAALARLALPEVVLISLDALERYDPALLAVKPTRSRIEYYFTSTPSLPLLILDQDPAVDLITYLDADLYFFADPAPLYAELHPGSVAIIAHRFAPAVRHLEAHGLYNVGWLSFRRDARGMACLRWWRERCLEWCYDRAEAGRYADQKYLDDWPTRFPGVVTLAHKGANLGPWNLDNYRLCFENGQVWVDDQPLLFFHFHGLKPVRGRMYDTHLRSFKTRLSPVLRQHVYQPYLRILSEAYAQGLSVSGLTPGQERRLWPQRRGLSKMLSRLKNWLTGQYVWA